jgi:SAM-dependent MidA family methyltransferase
MRSPDSTFPPPSAEAQAHSARVLRFIRAQIEAAGGSISFAQYMAQALYAPGLGYYSAGAHKFGEAGDFVTAPEISPLFGKTVAQQIQPVLAQLEAPVVLELGAGTGALAEQILQALAEHDALPQAYWILEPSAELQQRQQQRLTQALPAEIFARVRWLQQIPEASFTGVILGNEVIDALPCALVEKTEQGLFERVVEWRADALAWTTRPLTPALTEALERIPQSVREAWPYGYVTELRTTLRDWLAALVLPLRQGAMFWIDYGYGRREYYHPERIQGTLRCFYRHRAHDDPFLWPGLQDITAHVDFTDLAEAAHAADLQIAGYTTQASFLLAGGLLNRAEQTTDARVLAEQSRALQVLLMPGQMGELIKVMALTRGVELPQHFAEADLRRQL